VRWSPRRPERFFFFSKVDISWPDMFSFRHVSAFLVYDLPICVFKLIYFIFIHRFIINFSIFPFIFQGIWDYVYPQYPIISSRRDGCQRISKSRMSGAEFSHRTIY
jgi:hypothetical protein